MSPYFLQSKFKIKAINLLLKESTWEFIIMSFVGAMFIFITNKILMIFNNGGTGGTCLLLCISEK